MNAILSRVNPAYIIQKLKEDGNKMGKDIYSSIYEIGKWVVDNYEVIEKLSELPEDIESIKKLEDLMKKDLSSLTKEDIKRIFKVIEEAREGKEFLPMAQNNGIFDMMYNITKLKKGKKDHYGLVSKLETKTGGIEVQSNEKFPMDVLLKKLSDSQIQLICYTLHLKQLQNTEKITLNINDFFELKGIEKQDNNVKKLLEDLAILERMYFTFEANTKGKKVKTHYSKVISMTDIYTKKSVIKLTFGDWCQTLRPDQYSLFNKAFLKYGCSRRDNQHTIKLSLKLNEIMRNNLKTKNEWNSLNVGKLIDLLDFNENTVKAKGYVKAVKDVIDNALDTIAAVEGYLWQYRKTDHEDFNDYKKDFIEFKNDKMLEAYRNYDYNPKELNGKK